MKMKLARSFSAALALCAAGSAAADELVYVYGTFFPIAHMDPFTQELRDRTWVMADYLTPGSMYLSKDETGTFTAAPPKGYFTRGLYSGYDGIENDPQNLALWTRTDQASDDVNVVYNGRKDGETRHIAPDFGLVRYNLSYNFNGGSGAVPPVATALTVTNAFAVAACTGVKTGYTFAGWTTAGGRVVAENTVITADRVETGDYTVYTLVRGNAAEVFGLGNADNQNVVLTAQWTANAYGIEYSLDGGSAGTPSPTGGVYDQVVEVAPPVKTGYDFSGWRIRGFDAATADFSQFGSGNWRKIAEEVQPIAGTASGTKPGTLWFRNLHPSAGATVTLEAVFVPHVYSATFSLPSSASGTYTERLDFEYMQQLSVKNLTVPGGFTTGELFAGYYTQANGQGECWWNADGVAVHGSGVWDVAGDMTFYAKLDAYEFTIRYLPGEHMQGAESNVTYRCTDSFTLESGGWFTCDTGYGLLGRWRGADGKDYAFGLTGNARETFGLTGPKVVVLYAMPNDTRKIVDFKGNGGTPDSTRVVRTRGGILGEVFPAVVWDRDRKLLAGWNSDKDGLGDVITPQTVLGGDDKELVVYAQWTNAWYHVAYHGGEGAVGVMPVEDFEFNVSAQLTANAFRKTGYTFAVWTNLVRRAAFPDRFTVSATEPLADGKDDTVDLQAVWSANTNVIRFVGGSYEDLTGSMEPQVISYDTSARLSRNAFSRGDLWTFAGWSLNGSEVVDFLDGAEVRNLSAENGEVPLYAVWRSNLTALSDAMNCDSLIWNNNPSDQNPGRWIVRNGLGYDSGSCVAAEGAPAAGRSRGLRADRVAGNGILTFYWRADDSSARLFLRHGGKRDSSEYEYTGATGEWRQERCYVNFHGDLDGAYFEFTCVSPGGGAVYIDRVVFASGSYTVVYNGNGATAGTMAPQDFVFCPVSEQRLRANAYSRSGCRFTGWATNAVDAAAGVIGLADEARIENLCRNIGDTIELFALWDDLGALSKAMHCGGMAWSCTDPATGTGTIAGEWVAKEAAGAGMDSDSCVVVSGGKAQCVTKLLQASVTGSGTLSFWRKVVGLNRKPILSFKVETAGTAAKQADIKPTTDGEWERYVYQVAAAGNAKTTFTIQYYTAGAVDISIDRMNWVPSGCCAVVYMKDAGGTEFSTVQLRRNEVHNLMDYMYEVPSGSAFAGWSCADTHRIYDGGLLVWNLAGDGEVITMYPVFR